MFYYPCYELNMLCIHTCYITPHIHHTPLKFLFHFYIFFFRSFSFVSSLLEAKRLLKCVEKIPLFAASCVIQQICVCCAYDSLGKKLNEFGMVVLGRICLWYFYERSHGFLLFEDAVYLRLVCKIDVLKKWGLRTPPHFICRKAFVHDFFM